MTSQNPTLKPLGVAAAFAQSESDSDGTTAARTRRSAFDLFALTGRVALVTGAQRGIGLEMALALAEAGATGATYPLFPRNNRLTMTV